MFPDFQCKQGKWTLTAPDVVGLGLYSKVICWIADSNNVSGNFKHHNTEDLLLRLSFNNLTPALRVQHTHTRQKRQPKLCVTQAEDWEEICVTWLPEMLQVMAGRG